MKVGILVVIVHVQHGLLLYFLVLPSLPWFDLLRLCFLWYVTVAVVEYSQACMDWVVVGASSSSSAHLWHLCFLHRWYVVHSFGACGQEGHPKIG